jgi:hypothetical protein
MGRVFSFSQTTPRLSFMAVLHSDSQQQPQPPSAEQACPATLGDMRHNQQHVPSQSVHAPNANSLSVNDIFKVVATIFQQIIRELNGAKSEEDRIMAITKILLKLVKQKCPLEVIGGKYECTAEQQQQQQL